MDSILGSAFPEMPIGMGVDRALATWHHSVQRSALTLVTLSWLIVPVCLALSLKAFQLLGPLGAFVVAAVPFSAVLHAESLVRERSILPLPPDTEHLRPEKHGKPTVADDGKDEKVSKEASYLQGLLWGGELPPPTPRRPALATARVDGGGTLQQPGESLSRASGARNQPLSQGTARPVHSATEDPSNRAPGGTAKEGGSIPLGGGAHDDGDDADAGSSSSLQRSEAAFLINRVYETVYGQRLQVALHDVDHALRVCNQLRGEIGLPPREDGSGGYDALLAAARETGETVGV